MSEAKDISVQIRGQIVIDFRGSLPLDRAR